MKPILGSAGRPTPHVSKSKAANVLMVTIALGGIAMSNAFVHPRMSPIISHHKLIRQPSQGMIQPLSTSTTSGVASTTRLAYIPGIEVSDVTYDSVSTAFDAWEWTNAIGAPAALVAGAVLVTLSETRENTAPRKTDTRRTRFLKLSMRFLLLTSFALEVVSIFTATITGTVLLGQSEHASIARKMIGYDAPLQLMKHHHEYVLIRILATRL